MEHKYSFEKLEVWKDARIFVTEIYKLTDVFPSSEKYGLISQIKRASVSIASNIAEGISRFSDKEKIRFVEIAYGSVMEVYCQLCIALDLNFITNNQFDIMKKRIECISAKLNALKRAYFKRIEQ
jgi:four helix bundle protein